jgi:hypothetical protein
VNEKNADKYADIVVSVVLAEEMLKLQEENRRLRDALSKIPEQDRRRGYPTGEEWRKLVEEVRFALEEK